MSSSSGSSVFKYSNTNRQKKQKKIHFLLLWNTSLWVQMHQHVMMLHAKYTILYIKVQCHDGLTLRVHNSVNLLNTMIISFRVLLLFAQDMREWIHNSPPKKTRIKKKALSHTHTHTHTDPTSARQFNHTHISYQPGLRPHSVCCSSVCLFVFGHYYTQKPHPVSLLWI